MSRIHAEDCTRGVGWTAIRSHRSSLPLQRDQSLVEGTRWCMMVYDCAAHLFSDILAQSLLPRHALARSLVHCSLLSLAVRRLVGHAVQRRCSNIASIPGIDIPPRSAAPPKRTLARCRASRRAVRTDDGWVAHPHSWSKFSFPHLMLTSVAMRSSPLTPCKAPAKRAEQGSAH